MADSVPETQPQRSPAEWLDLAKAEERAGELFDAYDLAMQGHAQHPDDWALKHRAVLCLASTGATEQARELAERLGITKLGPAERAAIPQRLALDLQTIVPRLDRDEALASKGAERQRLLLNAAKGYEAVYQQYLEAGLADDYYPGICCANLRLLGGETEAAMALARELLRQLAEWPTPKSYYELATEIEAELIVGDLKAAAKVADLLRADIQKSPDFRAIARTIQQLHLVAEAKGFSVDPSGELALPRVIHFLGHIISAPGGRGRFPAAAEADVRARIEQELAGLNGLFAYGSLAAGADILFAETVLKQHGSLHVVLPFEIEEFINISVRPAGEQWVERFRYCYEQATACRFATEDGYLGDEILFSYCSQLAMGLAQLRAALIGTRAEQIAVWDGRPPTGPAGTAADMEIWRETGQPQTHIEITGGEPISATASAAGRTPVEISAQEGHRRTRAMLFGDIKGFSKLTDRQLPNFVSAMLGTVARVTERFAADILLKNTWGDGLFLVFDDAGKAAECALQLQEALGAVDLKANGLPETMALRLGGHLGPVYNTIDPVLERSNFFGAHVSRAARIEPVTPEKLVYVTETLAAVLRLHNADQFTCHYVGNTKAAKDYGSMRMFVLTRKTG
jgi:class 3 adenylate cyclase